MTRARLIAAACILMLAGPAAADEVHFLNGDRLSGRIVGAAGGKLTIRTEAAGEVTVDLAGVRTFSTDEPVTVRVGTTTLRSAVAPGEDGRIRVVPAPGAAPVSIALRDISHINPPPAWKGSITVNGRATRGNTDTAALGVSLDAVRRGERDRLTAGAGYFHGREADPDSGEERTTTDNMFVSGKYDYFLARRLYVFGALRVERDRIADLDLRLTPSAGGGYQWFESPVFNLATEAGLAWVYENFRDGSDDEHVAGRLAYRTDWTPHRSVRLFHSLEWLPAAEDPLADYNLNADAGVRTTIVRDLFAEIKVELRYDSIPAPGSEPEDLRYLLGVGWSF